MTFPSNLKALKANVICYMAKREKPFSQQYLQRVQSVPFLKILKAWTKRLTFTSQTIPNVLRITGATVGALGITAGGVLIADVHF